ncbi:response regulator [Pseudomonas sp. GCM10022188]|uniref:response regulator n=1 Tax=Pseudomonas TaxID=286 RepID=UPI001E395D12|nr:response regulator transcription factor [Pseudomonas oryzagri]MCC6075883.1 response regulator transcription factor [Pseudomonas oryzagri]
MNILIVDDHAVVRQGYASLLATLLEGVTVSEAASGEEALQRVAQGCPELVILDVGLPGISGLETARRLRARQPQLRVLFFSMHDELPVVRKALEAGASGYLTKSAAPQVLLEAVRKVLAGHTYIEHGLATALACTGGDGQDPRLGGMTQRELEIFVLLARGVGLRQIADKLCISAKTVANYQTQLKNKLQVGSQSELVHLAIDTGLLRVGQVGA